MADRKKVIKGLEICYCLPAKCEDCPYHDLPDEQSCNDTLCLDVLALLKEQPEIVRCISCTFYRSDGECALHNGKWRPEGFCSWAIKQKGR